jgi:hypothetical protein
MSQTIRPIKSTLLSVSAMLAVFLLAFSSSAAEAPSGPQWSLSHGNTALLVLSDSAAVEERRRLDKTLLSALDHFGMPFEVLDLSKEPLAEKTLLAHCGVVIAQAGLGKRLSDNDVMALKGAIEKGVGLVSFDGMLATYPAAYRQMLGVQSTGLTRAVSVRITRVAHPITQSYDPAHEFQLIQPVDLTALDNLPKAQILLETEGKLPTAFAAQIGKGRIVQFTLSPNFWLPDYFGHVHGLDGLFWRAIVWTARKPFVMMAMPPFVTARIDDAAGSGSRYLDNADSAAVSFRYIGALNQFGYIPNVGLFTDDIKDEDGKVLKQKFDQGLAEFSAHAWTETHFIYIDRVRAAKGNRRMVEFSTDDLRQRFDKLDRQFATWGIKPSRTLNCHCFSPGVNALPFLKERGETFMMFAGRFGVDYYDPAAYTWNPKPYGDPGFTCDYMPDYPDFFNVEAHPYQVRAGKINDADIDILGGNTTFNKETVTNRLSAAAHRGAEEISLGLDSLFFGCLFTHEQRVAALTVGEWNQVLDEIDRLTRNRNKIFKSYDYISEYAKSRYDTKIIEADFDPKLRMVRLRVAGKSTLPLKVYVFSGEDLGYQFRELPVFRGEQSVVLD